MAKWQNDSMLDAALNYIKNGATLETVCTQQPTTRTEAAATYSLGSVVVSSANFTLANGDTSGRKCTVAVQNSVPVTATGTANYVALMDSSNLMYVTTTTAKSLTSGDTMNIPAWDIEIADAS